jgi:hypothetical protein
MSPISELFRFLTGVQVLSSEGPEQYQGEKSFSDCKEDLNARQCAPCDAPCGSGACDCGCDAIPVPPPLDFADGIYGQLQSLDFDLANVCDRVSRLGLLLRDDGITITEKCPPVASVADAVEFINVRVDALNRLLDSIAHKSGLQF